MFVSFTTNNNYCKLAEVMIKSIHEFSKEKIILYCVNFDKPDYADKYERLICKRIDYDNSYSIYFLKPKIILDSIINMGVKKGIYIESDDIATKNVDHLFDECNRITTYPLSPIHPKDPNNQYHMMKALGISEKSMPYIHAHLVFTDTNIDFIKEWLEICMNIGNSANYDETCLNLMFWKHKINDYIDYIYDPYFKSVYDVNRNSEKIYFYHGCKNISEAEEIFNILQQRQ